MNDCTIHFDGGVRGNVAVDHPLFAQSRGAWAWVAHGKGGMRIRQDAGAISPATSMMAELHGALHALAWAASARYEHVVLCGDSRFVIEWLRGRNRTSQAPHLARLQYQIAQFIAHEVVPRSGNRCAIRLTQDPGRVIVTPRYVPNSKNRYADSLCTQALRAA